MTSLLHTYFMPPSIRSMASLVSNDREGLIVQRRRVALEEDQQWDYPGNKAHSRLERLADF